MSTQNRLVVESTIDYSVPPDPSPAELAEVGAIASYVRAGRCALFVGSGLSVGAGLPTWNGLVQQVIAATNPLAMDPQIFVDPDEPASGRFISLVDDLRAAKSDPLVKRVRQSLGAAVFQREVARLERIRGRQSGAGSYLDALAEIQRQSLNAVELRRLAQDGRYQEAAAFCRDALGRGRYLAAVRSALSQGNALAPTHLAIVRTPFACVGTTNLDDLLERAYERLRGFRPPAPTGAELNRHGDLLLRGAFFILKAHGDLGTPESLVLTADDYRRVVHENPAFQASINGILMTHAVVFVGYSLSDINFKLLLDGQLTAFRGRVPPRFAVMSGVGPVERDTLWRTARLRVLPYPEGRHEDVLAFLDALADLTVREPVPGPERAPPAAEQAPPSPHDVLTITTVGDRLHFDLRSLAADGAETTLWIGARTWQGFETLRERVAQTLVPPGTQQEWNRRQRRAGTALTRLVPEGLRQALGARPRGHPLELVTSPGTEPLPWEWTSLVGGCLGVRAAVVRRPVGLSSGARGRRLLAKPLHALIMGYTGPAEGGGMDPLPQAEAEADHAARLLRARPLRAVVTRLSGPDATAERLVSELAQGHYDLVHFGGHAWADPQDAYLYFWDRMVLGTELAPLLSRHPPSLLVISTHHSAFFPLDLDRDARITPEHLTAPEQHGDPPEDRGLAALALRCGVTSFVGCCGMVSDAGSARVMAVFYERLVHGDTVPEALRLARARTLEAGDTEGLAFVTIGEPDFRLAPEQPSRTAVHRQGQQPGRRIAAGTRRGG
ncbi:MAG: SIR2 family protein [Burkholderiaceae bacterium]|nr:SIR2 family protein [Burkholderiaceae bacterium]